MEALVKLLIPFVLGGLVALFFILFTDVETQMKYASLLISYFIPFLGYRSDNFRLNAPHF
ncbi:MAG: hypothetical protein MW690_000746 [Methanophagales archaeon]|nr:hypothetical protein [Methanophagales archaeon]